MPQTTTTPRLLAALLSAAALSCAQAAEFRSADIHNSDDYPTVAAVKHMSQYLEQKSGGKYKIKVFNKGRARHREGNHRPGQDRRAGDDTRQHQPDERGLRQDASADDALPVPLGGAHARLS